MNPIVVDMLRKIVELLESHDNRLMELEAEETRESASESELMAEITELATRLQTPESLVTSELSE